MPRLLKTLLAALAVGMLSSCFGAKGAVVIGADGAGVITLEYRVASAMLAVGAEDGNANSPTFPAGRKDFEHAVSRINGLSLTDYSIAYTQKDTVYTVSLAYKTLPALAAFLDATGTACKIPQTTNGHHSLTLAFLPEARHYPAYISKQLSPLFKDYNFNFTLTFPSTPTITLHNKTGAVVTALPAGKVSTTGRNVSFSAPMDALLTKGGGIIEAIW
jgi:hypothetical protein